MIRLTWVGHATVVIDVDDVRLLTDPLLRRHAGPLRRIGGRPDPEAWYQPDAVLLSHLHSDHAAIGSLGLVRGAPVLSGERNGRWLRKRVGLQVPDVGEDAWTMVGPGGDIAPPTAEPERGVAVRLVRADHGARPMPHRPNDTHGHLIRTTQGTIWFAGDTSLYDEMSDLPSLAGEKIDVALLPIGGWGPRLSPGHMGPREAVEAVRRVRPRAVLPIHFGTLYAPGLEVMGLAWMHRPLVEFEQTLAAELPDVTLLRPGLGETVQID